MTNSKGSSGIRNLMYSGKHALLPPKIPFPSVSQVYADCMPNPAICSKIVQKTREGSTHHHRTSSESIVMEETPSWLDDLLNESDTPVRRGGHRRSSSDSFAYLDSANVSNIGYADQNEYKFRNMVSIPSWSSQDFDHSKEMYRMPMHAEMNSTKLKNRAWDSCLNVPSGKDNVAFQSSGLSSPPHEADGVPSTANEKHDSVESGAQDAKSLSERKDGTNAKSAASETDTKRAKQPVVTFFVFSEFKSNLLDFSTYMTWRRQFDQRSRVRKLQYIAELERNVCGFQAEGSKVSAELEFLNQQNLILSMENKALKHRLESLAQEQLINYLEQEVLEREIGRLRALYQWKPPQQPSAGHGHRRSNSLESQFANLSLKHKDTNPGRDPVTGVL